MVLVSLVFLFVTAEEKGLLGTEYYVSNPLYALGKTAGVLNTDGGALYGPARDFSISGSAKLGLLDMLTAEAAKQGRTYSPDERPEAGSFFRSDHFPFAKRGVPVFNAPGANANAVKELVLTAILMPALSAGPPRSSRRGRAPSASASNG